MRIMQTILAAAILPQTGTQVSEKAKGWELEWMDCGAIPGQGLLLTVGRGPEGL